LESPVSFMRKLLKLTAKYGWGTTLVVLGAFAVGFTWSSSDELYSNIRLFDRVALMVYRSYVEDLDETKMVKAGIDGMLTKLDKYTKYLDGPDYLYLRQETDGRIEGIGAYLEIHRDTLTVTSVQEGSPGYKIGIRPGDRILTIDSVQTTGKAMGEIRTLIQGPIGSNISLRVSRPGDGEFEVTTERAEIQIDPIPYCGMISDDVGYARLVRFSEDCYESLRKALFDLKRQGMKSLILDLRGNPGGLLSEAIRVAGAFLPANTAIVETRGRSDSLDGLYVSDGPPIFESGGLAVLVDSETASAAEIVAGAIQDHDRGVVIGDSTYGKGLVQQILQLTDDSALKITASKYYLPSGRCLQKPGWSDFELTSNDMDDYEDEMFTTVSGRPVFGGGGIVPDIFIDGTDKSEYVAAMRRQSLFFDFATEYLRRSTVKGEFEIDDTIMVEFREFVNLRGFEFEDDDQLAFDDFKNSFSVIDDESRQAIDVLDSRLSSRDQWLFDSHYMEIARNLKEAVTLQARGEKSLYRIWTESQPQILEAADILADQQEYEAILAHR
jgi:carboxyl-terminal processing protease